MSLAVFLAACSNSPITSHSTGFWDHYIIYNCSRFIIWLSNNFGGYGMGIIIFTIIVRIIILPLMVYQTKMSVKIIRMLACTRLLRCCLCWFSCQLCGHCIKPSGGRTFCAVGASYGCSWATMTHTTCCRFWRPCLRLSVPGCQWLQCRNKMP